MIAEHYGMPPLVVFFFCGGGKITLIMCGRTDRMAAIEPGGPAWTGGGLCYCSSGPASAAPCVCVCIAGTPERQALGAAPASVNQKERKKTKH